MGKGVGKLHVPVVTEPDAIVYGAVALIVEDEAVARGEEGKEDSPDKGNGGKPDGKRPKTMHRILMFHL